MIKNKKVLVFLSFLTMFITACSNSNNEAGNSNEVDTRQLADEPFERQEFMLGTIVNIKVYDEDGEEALDKAIERIDELDGTFSMTNQNSEIYAINEASGKEPVKVSDNVYHVIDRAVNYAKESDGRMDPTIGALTSLWGIGTDEAAVPSQEEIDEVLPLVDYTQVELNEEDQSVYLPQEGMKLDLGSIAKGYITDAATDVLVEEGVTTAIVDLGGDIYLLGASSRGANDKWRIGVQNPFEDRGEIVGLLPVIDEAVVTSGIYERLITDDEGNEYHHILNPETGYPFDNEIAGLSVTADTAMDGDALSTVLFSMGLEDGLEYAATLEGVTAVFVTRDHEVYISEGNEANFELLDDSFEYKGAHIE